MSLILSYLERFIFTIPVLLIAFPIHEFSHAATAYALGDKTAKNMGRLTLNPFKHLDLIGTICLIFFRFGWAKPVPVNPYNFKNPKGGMAVTSLAGPLSNLIMGFLSLFLEGCYNVAFTDSVPSTVTYIIQSFLITSAYINMGLCIFNLIPMPPLDGEKILAFFLPDSMQEFFDRYMGAFQIILLLLLFSPILSGPLNYMVTNIYNNSASIINHIFSLFTEYTSVVGQIS